MSSRELLNKQEIVVAVDPKRMIAPWIMWKKSVGIEPNVPAGRFIVVGQARPVKVCNVLIIVPLGRANALMGVRGGNGIGDWDGGAGVVQIAIIVPSLEKCGEVDCAVVVVVVVVVVDIVRVLVI